MSQTPAQIPATCFRVLIMLFWTVLAHGQSGLQELRISNAQWSRLETAVQEAVTTLHLPSLSVAVVHNGTLVWTASSGTLAAHAPDQANSATMYAVASNTKAFTSAALAKMVDAGQIDWKDRVHDYLPDFDLYDPYVSSELRIEDLLCHRSGLATFSGDLLWYGSKWSAEEVLHRARHLQPVSGFRTEFGYQNILYIAAGKVIEKVSGMPWDRYVRDSLLTPIGMERAALSTLELNGMPNVAQPHNELENGELVPIEWINWDNMAPAGALIASVEEMSKWMVVQLDSGRVGDQRLWTREETEKMWSLHTPLPVSNFYRSRMPSMHFRGYGLGWEMCTLHGRKIVGHSGGYDGMISRQVLVPSEKLGIFIATNTNSSVPWALGYDALGILLENQKETPLLDYLRERKANEPEEKAAAEAELMEKRIKDTQPSHSLDDYAGTYEDEMYGALTIQKEGDSLSFQFEPTALFVGHLEHWHYDTFRLHWDRQMMLPSGMAHFQLNASGAVESLEIDVPNPDFDFTELHFNKIN